MRDYSKHLEPGLVPKRKHHKYPFLLLLLAIVIISSFFFIPVDKNQSNNKTNSITPEKQKTVIENIPKILPVNINIKTEKELLDKISDTTQKSKGTFSVYLYDLKTKKGSGVNENMVISAASINKLLILASLYNLAGKGEIDLEKIIILQKEDIQDYGTGSIRYDEPGTPYSLKTLARLMIQKSDNTAAYLLANQVLDMNKIQNYGESLGLVQTSMTDNKTSVKDMSILLTKIYEGDITTKSLTLEMLGFMTNSDFEDRIPAGLPEGTKIYHKTGDDIGKIHDVGIVEPPNRTYYLGVMTTDITDEVQTKKTIAEIASFVYVYMKRL